MADDGSIGTLAQNLGIECSPSSVSFTAAGGTADIEIYPTVGTGWEVSDGSLPDWCSLDMMEASGPAWVRLTVWVNPSSEVRDAEVVVSNDDGGLGSFDVHQDGNEATIALTPASLTVPAVGGFTDWVAVDSSDGTAHIDEGSLPSWLTLTAWDGLSFRLEAAANTALESRSSAVRVYSDSGVSAELAVTQEASVGWWTAYAGEFPDIRGRVWRCEILRAAEQPPEEGELEFPADRPLVIEWPSINFEDVMWGSSATLRVVSPGDRTYIDLYTIEPGGVRLDVYRDGSLYWSGMLDPEFYEEPYERLSGYEVALTFTDFGILDRLKYDLEGVRAVRDIINDAVERSGLNHNRKNLANKFSYVWTGIRFGADRQAQESDLFEDTTGIAVRSDNFTDEEGEVMSVAEALEGALQPLGLKMVQREGRIYLFDPIGLREYFEGDGGDIPSVTWSGDSQTLGVDRVYNSVTVTFSPYAQTEWVGDDCIEYTDEYNIAWYDLTYDNSGTHNGGKECYTYYPDYSQYGTGDPDYTDMDFTIFLGAGEGVDLNRNAEVSFFHILPVYGSADECSGVAYSFVAGHNSLAGGGVRRHLTTTLVSGAGHRVFTLPRVHVTALPDADDRAKYLLRLVQEVLFDCRYNPFNGADDNNEAGNQDTLEDNSAFVFLRASVTLYDSAEGGTALWHYDNSAVAQGDGERALKAGVWQEGEDGGRSVWLEWYSPDNLRDNSGGAGGWKANRHCIGKPDGSGGRNGYTDVNALLRNAPDGEFIPYPPAGGWLEVVVTDSVYGYDYGRSAGVGDADRWTDRGVYDDLRWWLYRAPTLSLVRNNLEFDDADLDDVEYRGTLAEGAQDDLGIDTVCGTADGAPPTARGLYSRLYYDVQPTEMYRDGATGRPEELLINQLYKQYAGRRAVITGEAEIPESLLLMEQNQEGAAFILTADSEDIRMGVSDIEIRELGEDTYTPQ